MIGEKLSPILEEIEIAIFEHENRTGDKPNYTELGFRGGVKIFMSVMMDKLFELQDKDDIDLEDRMNMAASLGNDIKKLIKTYVNIDTTQLYK